MEVIILILFISISVPLFAHYGILLQRVLQNIFFFLKEHFFINALSLGLSVVNFLSCL